MKLLVLLVCVSVCCGQWNNGDNWNMWNNQNMWNNRNTWSGWSGAPMASTYAAPRATAAWDPWSQTSPSMGNAFAYNDGRSARNTLLGISSDSYRYIDARGKVQTVYQADTAGFRAQGINMPMMRMAAPMPVMDTPEVAAAKADFMAKFRMAEQGAMPMTRMAGPAPVQDTAEVAAAKAEFMAKFREAEMRQRKRRSLLVGLSHTPASTALLPLRAGYWAGTF